MRNHPEFTLVTDSASPAMVAKGFSVKDAMAKSDFGTNHAAAMGFTCDAAAIKRVMDSDPEYKAAVERFAQDVGFNLGDANIDSLGQFFMVFNEATINALYRGRTAAQTFGVKTMGDWTTEKIIFKTRELTGATGLYDDWSRAPYSNYNYGWDTRDTLRLEWALEVTKYEEMVGSVMRRNPYKDKKDAIVLAQDIWLNNFFWHGSTVDSKKLYGATNDPNLAGRKTNMTVDFASSTITVDQVVAQLLVIKQKMATELKGNGDINSLRIHMCCPLSWQSAFTAPNTYNGYTANKWIAENWKNCIVEFKPELEDEDDGDPMMIVFAEEVPGVGMSSINLMQTSKLRLVGAMPTLKGREEAYSASVAGALVACPLAVRIWTSPGAS